jgi:hypothetical protein
MVQILNATGITWPVTIPRMVAVDGAGNPLVVSIAFQRIGNPTLTVLNEPIPGADPPAP